MALSILCNRIESLVKSPLFEHSRVIDVQHSTKASGDLKSILELSGSIREKRRAAKQETLALTEWRPVYFSLRLVNSRPSSFNTFNFSPSGSFA